MNSSSSIAVAQVHEQQVTSARRGMWRKRPEKNQKSIDRNNGTHCLCWPLSRLFHWSIHPIHQNQMIRGRSLPAKDLWSIRRDYEQQKDNNKRTWTNEDDLPFLPLSATLLLVIIITIINIINNLPLSDIQWHSLLRCCVLDGDHSLSDDDQKTENKI